MKHAFAAAGAGITATAYAVALATKRGHQFRRDYTWLSVIVGVSATLAWLALADKRAAHRALEMFAITGTPIVILCVAEDMAKAAALTEHLQKR